MAGADADFLHRWSRWLNWWTLLCLPGAALATTVWGIRGTLLVSAAIGFLTFLTLSGMPTIPHDPAWKLRWILRVSTCAAAGFLSVILLAQWGGPLWLILGATMSASSPPGIAAVRRWVAKIPSNRPKPTPPDSAPMQLVPASLENVSDVELCCLWRHTFWDLGTATSPPLHAQIVEHRQEILDELIRRNSTAIEAWLATEPRASESPERFFRGDDHGHATAA